MDFQCIKFLFWQVLLKIFPSVLYDEKEESVRYMKKKKIITHCIALGGKSKLGPSDPSWEFVLIMQAHAKKVSQNGAGGFFGTCLGFRPLKAQKQHYYLTELTTISSNLLNINTSTGNYEYTCSAWVSSLICQL